MQPFAHRFSIRSSSAHDLLDTEEDKSILNRFKFGARCDGERLFNLILGAAEYHLIHMTVDVAGGTVQSMLTLILSTPVQKPQSQQYGADGSAPRGALTFG